VQKEQIKLQRQKLQNVEEIVKFFKFEANTYHATHANVQDISTKFLKGVG
jgi:hypothetical protein